MAEIVTCARENRKIVPPENTQLRIVWFPVRLSRAVRRPPVWEDPVECLKDFMSLTRLGLVFNLVGTIMVAFSFGKNLGEGHQKDKKGRPVYLASFLHPCLFYLGMFFVFLGFSLHSSALAKSDPPTLFGIDPAEEQCFVS
jgi:hypothetical protein